MSHHRSVVLQHGDKDGTLGELPPSSFLSQNERQCQKCGERFIPTIHKSHQKFCQKCKNLAEKDRKKRNYQLNKYRHTSVRLTTKNAEFVRNNGISIGKFVNKKIEEMRKMMQKGNYQQ